MASWKSSRPVKSTIFGAARAFDQDLHGSVRKLEELQHRRDGPDLVQRRGLRIVIGGVPLGDEQHVLVFAHDLFERANRLLATDEQAARSCAGRRRCRAAAGPDRWSRAQGCAGVSSACRSWGLSFLYRHPLIPAPVLRPDAGERTGLSRDKRRVPFFEPGWSSPIRPNRSGEAVASVYQNGCVRRGIQPLSAGMGNDSGANGFREAEWGDSPSPAPVCGPLPGAGPVWPDLQGLVRPKRGPPWPASRGRSRSAAASPRRRRPPWRSRPPGRRSCSADRTSCRAGSLP